MKIGITGNKGFLGSHLLNYLITVKGMKIIPFERHYFDNKNLLGEFVSNCEVIFHLAAINRHEDQNVIYNTNVSLVQKLIQACVSIKATPHILFSSPSLSIFNNILPFIYFSICRRNLIIITYLSLPSDP